MRNAVQAVVKSICSRHISGKLRISITYAVLQGTGKVKLKPKECLILHDPGQSWDSYGGSIKRLW